VPLLAISPRVRSQSPTSCPSATWSATVAPSPIFDIVRVGAEDQQIERHSKDSIPKSLAFCTLSQIRTAAGLTPSRLRSLALAIVASVRSHCVLTPGRATSLFAKTSRGQCSLPPARLRTYARRPRQSPGRRHPRQSGLA
jgi:hypothetical protein